MARINADAKGGRNTTVDFMADDNPARPSHTEAFKAVTADLDSGTIDTLLIIGGNPIYDGPADGGFAAAGCEDFSAGADDSTRHHD